MKSHHKELPNGVAARGVSGKYIQIFTLLFTFAYLVYHFLGKIQNLSKVNRTLEKRQSASILLHLRKVVSTCTEFLQQDVLVTLVVSTACDAGFSAFSLHWARAQLLRKHTH